jgi:hypothetical protein
MITGFTIKEVSYHGTVVEYHDDRGISKSLNLIPPISKDGEPMSIAALRKEIARCAPNLDTEYSQISENSTKLKFVLNIGEKYTLSQSEIDNWDIM